MNSKVNEMWIALAAYQRQADANGHGKSWKKMCSKKTARYAHFADYDVSFNVSTSAVVADATAYACAANGPDSEIFAQLAISSIKQAIDVKIIIRNAIITPDGTYLCSYHRHDYKSHLDKISNEVYIVDGGKDYLRRSVNIVHAEELSVYSSDNFELVRRAFVWKSYGKDGEHAPDGIYISLSDMTTSHINDIICNQHQIEGTYVHDLMNQELTYRRENLY